VPDAKLFAPKLPVHEDVVYDESEAEGNKPCVRVKVVKKGGG